MSAKPMCTLCHWASLAGGQGDIKKFALSPKSQSGKFANKIDAAMGINMKDDGNLFRTKVPVYAKHDAARSFVNLPMQLPHEVLSREIENDPSILRKLEEKMEGSDWVTAYKDHKVVKDWASRGKKPLPCCIYLDGVAVTRREGVLGVWMYNEISERRHLLAVIRKSSLCKCGCRGQCSLYCILKTIHWSIACLSSGKYPSVDPDGVPLSGWRSDVAGLDLPTPAAFVHIKGDWMEFSTSLGLPTWQSNQAPCPFCTVEKKDMFKLDPFDPKSSPWTHVSHKDYEESCKRAETVVEMDRGQHAEIVELLYYDKKKTKGNRGRCLLRDYPALDLKKGDRLSPWGPLNDVADFEDAFKGTRQKTYRACFWRTSEEYRARWRNPLFDEKLGITTDILAIDYLHTLYLGLAKITVWRRCGTSF